MKTFKYPSLLSRVQKNLQTIHTEIPVSNRECITLSLLSTHFAILRIATLRDIVSLTVV